MKEYLTILENTESEFIINRSRFITELCRVRNSEEAKEFVLNVRKKYGDATHNCYAYISDKLGLEMKFSDDGEPQGTAGQPMLEVIRKKNLKETAVVVTRYFGGIKLGAGGLVSAYTESVVRCIDKAVIVRMVLCDCFALRLSYQQYANIEKFVRESCIIDKTEYNNDIELYISMPENSNGVVDRLNDLTSGQIEIIQYAKEYKSWK